ncbi:hypothetical protein D3C80_743810 [compost metagenome]
MLKNKKAYDTKRANIKYSTFLRTPWYQLIIFAINLIPPYFNKLHIICRFYRELFEPYIFPSAEEPITG